MMRRWIMHVDMDAFFASVEQLDHPEYKGHPVIVGGLSARGVVATASYEARAFGVRSAMPIAKARKLCPDGIYVYPRIDRYKEVSGRIFAILKAFTPHIEPLSLDEAFLDVTGMSSLYAGPKALGRAVKDRVFNETGLVISAGLAPNKFLAKLASDLDKPDGLVVIPYGKEEHILSPLPIKRIWGVGPRTERRLQDGGFKVLKDIQALPDETALIPFVGNQARRIWELARGIDDRPLEPHRKIQSVGNEETYEEDVSDPQAIDLELHYFSNRVARRLRQKGLAGHTVSIKVRYNDFTTVSRQKRLDSPTDHERVIYSTAVLLWNKLMQRGSEPAGTKARRDIVRATDAGVASETPLYTPLHPVRLLGVTVSGFEGGSLLQENLFSAERDETEGRLESALDGLASKFGEHAVMSGAVWRRFQGEAGQRRPRSELKARVDDDRFHEEEGKDI